MEINLYTYFKDQYNYCMKRLMLGCLEVQCLRLAATY